MTLTIAIGVIHLLANASSWSMRNRGRYRASRRRGNTWRSLANEDHPAGDDLSTFAQPPAAEEDRRDDGGDATALISLTRRRDQIMLRVW
jgi:hypothetical protein